MATVGPRVRSPGWTRARREHQGALHALLATIHAGDADAWRRPIAPGRWSPAQTAEHLVRVYEIVLIDVAGGRSIRARVRPWKQRLLRWFLLPHILFHRTIPVRARSPREVRPSARGLSRWDAAQRLRELGERLERDLAASLARDVEVNHPYFGPITPLQALRFCAVHLEHHHRQILDGLER